jgi:hypothetical protein
VRRWFQFFLRGRPFSGSNRRWWAGFAEALLVAALLLAGVVLFVVSLTLAALNWTPENGLYISPGSFALQLGLATVLIGIGTFCIARLLWHVGISAERRGAIATRANEHELLNEIRRRREDLPTVPRDQLIPRPGIAQTFRLTPFPRNIWGLVTATIFSVILITITTVLIIIVATSFGYGTTEWSIQLEEKLARNQLDTFSSRPWLAVAWLIPIAFAAGWAIYQFFRQLLKLTGIGPTSLEVSKYPLAPGASCRISLSQAGRVRLKLLDVTLVCQEEATFNEGTDIRTESSIVLSHTLFRQRGVSLRSGKPFEAEFDLRIPAGAMHSFKSTNNRVQWKIVVTGQAKSWPKLKRNFSLSVHPPAPLKTRPKRN